MLFRSILPATLASLAPSVLGGVSFNRDVQPILSENCFYCHGQDSTKRKKDLRLDDRAAALAGEAFLPGDAAASELVKRIFSADAEVQMPPPDSHRHLSPAQKETLRQWITEGAVYETHWTFAAPTKPTLPAVGNTAWPRQDLDRFVLSKLEALGLTPSPEADRTALIRRLHMDLTGLPPSPEEVDAFVADAAPDSYEKLVDRIMASPHYGERMALPWLDAARYADSNGFQQDGDTHQYVWRDWVVGALNADMPFDQFSIEQLAGDLLPNPTENQLVATGFNRNHLLNGEGGAIPEEQRNVVLFDRVDTTATTWMGLTLACAQCHDHKYDPITQTDYYSLMALFNNVPETGVPSGSGQYRIADPWIPIATEDEKAKLKQLQTASAEAKAAEKEAGKSPGTLAAYEAIEKELASGKPALEGSGKEPRPALPDDISAIAKNTGRSKNEAEQLRAYVSKNLAPPALNEARDKAKTAEKTLNDFKQGLARVMVMSDQEPRVTKILDRGNYLTPRGEVTGGSPAFLLPMPADAPKNRLGFAKWLFDPSHPLTARVQVNRFWQYFFGTGLEMGGKPVYPYQPDDVWETLAITKERDFTYPASSGTGLYRRSLYTFWRRTVGPVNMFDASPRQACRIRAGPTSTPLHALTTLNDITWTEAARVLAEKAMKASPERASQITWAFRRILSRMPTAKDLMVRMY